MGTLSDKDQKSSDSLKVEINYVLKYIMPVEYIQIKKVNSRILYNYLVFSTHPDLLFTSKVTNYHISPVRNTNMRQIKLLGSKYYNFKFDIYFRDSNLTFAAPNDNEREITLNVKANTVQSVPTILTQFVIYQKKLKKYNGSFLSFILKLTINDRLSIEWNGAPSDEEDIFIRVEAL